MTAMHYHITQPERPFARTNRQTIRQRARLLLGELQYDGLLVCICPNHTHMGEIQWLYHQVQASRAGVGLRLIHYSYATLTGHDEETEMRLKYVELWLGTRLDDAWEVRKSQG